MELGKQHQRGPQNSFPISARGLEGFNNWHVLAHRRRSGFLATPAGSIVPADLVYRHGGNWQEDAAKNAALRELVEEAGLQLDSSVAGHFFTLAKDTTLINQKFQDRFGKVHGVGACEKLHVPVRLF